MVVVEVVEVVAVGSDGRLYGGNSRRLAYARRFLLGASSVVRTFDF